MLPHRFGEAGHDLTHASKADVASYFQTLFTPRGDKLEAQVPATALSVYVTNSTLGRRRLRDGVWLHRRGRWRPRGRATFNVGSDGAAVDPANGSTLTILDVLLAVDRHATRSTTAAGFTL
jgi:hypothetical protein